MEPSSQESTPQEIAERVAVANLIERSAALIEQRWLDQVKSDLDTQGLPEIELRDAIPDYLKALAQELRSADGGDPLEELGRAAWALIVEEHGLTRVRLGFDIDELVHEFILLRRVIVETLQEQGLLLNTGVSNRLTDLIESAIAASNRSYVASRNYQSRRAEAEHISFVTHELRNPLTTAILAAAQLKQRVANKPDCRTLLDLIDRNHERLKQLIDKVLSHERLEADAAEIQPTETTLGQIMDMALRAAQARAREKGLRFHVEMNPAVRLKVDRDLTISIVQNLVDNAVKYTDHGEVEVSIEDLPTAIRLHVRDNCDGLSAEELKVIFEPFVRGHAPSEKGTGLGLSIARRAAEVQGGSIEAESPGERGCHFWMTLPKEVTAPPEIH